MQFIAGSHRGDIAEHYSGAHRSEMNGALETEVESSQAVTISLRPGDVTFHHCRMFHHTGGNYTDTPRRGLITHFWSSN
jgi:ectoine hydroxylase-related dioxygenase (phytanoyl-CoA dioxygenase family)